MPNRRTLLSRLKQCLLGVVVLLVGCSLLEQALEVRDRAELGASETFCTVAGKKVRYRLEGAEHSGPTVVLLNGLNACLEQWAWVQRGLSADSRVLTYDRGATGLSDWSDAHDADRQASELAGVLEATGTKDGFVIVGYSSSTFLARLFVARYPQLVKGLVFIDPATLEERAATPPYRVVSYRRDFARATITGFLRSLVGYTRLYGFLHYLHEPPPEPAKQKARAITVLSHHYLAVALDAWDLDRSSAQAGAAGLNFGSRPVGVLSTFTLDQDRFTYAGQHELVEKTTQGTFRFAGHIEHGDLLLPGKEKPVTDFIHEMALRVRARGP